MSEPERVEPEPVGSDPGPEPESVGSESAGPGSDGSGSDPEPLPEGPEEPESEEPEERRYPSTIGGAFYLAVLLATAVGMAIVWRADDWRLGVRVVAGALVAAGLFRLVLPQRDAGMLAVRHRLTDVVLLLLLGGGLLFLAGSVPEASAL